RGAHEQIEGVGVQAIDSVLQGGQHRDLIHGASGASTRQKETDTVCLHARSAARARSASGFWESRTSSRSSPAASSQLASSGKIPTESGRVAEAAPVTSASTPAALNATCSPRHG